MASEKTEALVLRVIEFSETSLIVTLMTRDFGKTSAVAKGARRPKSAFEGALDLLAVCRVLIIQKSGDMLDLLTEAKLERRFRAGQRDLRRLYAGYYLAELLRELTDQHDPSPALYDLATDTLLALDGDTEVDACLLRFELQMLRIIGHLPVIDSCAVCGEASAGLLPDLSVRNSRVPFGWQAGGVVCAACRPSTRGIVMMRSQAFEWLRDAIAEPAAEASSHELPSEIRGEMRGVMNQYLTHLIGSPLKLKPYISATNT